MFKLALRAVAGATCFISSLALAETPWATILLFGSSVLLLSFAVADGLVGEWRENRDRLEEEWELEQRRKLGRRIRRVADWARWEAEKRG